MLRNKTLQALNAQDMILNEVLSLNAQEFLLLMTARPRRKFLNEVLSLNAQE